MESCWERNPENRPTAGNVYALLQTTFSTDQEPAQDQSHATYSGSSLVEGLSEGPVSTLWLPTITQLPNSSIHVGQNGQSIFLI
jgi:hypothetical protein